jgi:sugar lactone lactonase YvrE
VWEGDVPHNPAGIRVNPDESLLVVADHLGRPVWSFRIAANGDLADAEPFYHLELPDEVAGGPPLRPGSDGLTFDDTGHLYVATNIGIQVCDQPGRVVGIIRQPGAERATNVIFGGPDMQTLYATTQTRVWKRHLRRKGVLPWQPVKLPRPQL